MDSSKKRFPRRFFTGLHWKLTFSYTLVTVVTLLIFELLLILGVLLFLGSDVLADLMINAMRTEFAPAAAEYLEQTPIDQNGLQIWLGDSIETQTEVNLDGSVEESSQLDIGPVNLQGANEALFVFDTELNLLAHTTGASTNGGESIISADEVLAQPVVANALAGIEDTESLRTRTDGVTVTAVPIRDDSENVLGVIVLTFELPILDAQILAPLLAVIGATLIPLTIGAIFIGTILAFSHREG